MGETSPPSAAPPDRDGQPSSSPGPASPPKESSCEQYLRRAASSTDYTVRRLDKLLSSSTGQEAVLAAITYGSQVVYHSLSSPPSLALLSKIQPLLRLQQQQQQQPKHTTTPTPPLLALSALASETRTTLRLFGLVGLWKWASTALKAPASDPVLRALTAAQISACVAFQVLENVAYLTSRGVLSKRLLDRWAGGTGKWFIWSVRAWMVHVLLQFVNLARRRQLAARRDAQATTASSEKKKGDKEGDEKQGETEEEVVDARARALELRAWKQSLVNNTAWAPLCVHWSVEGGIGVPGSLVGVFGFTARVWSLVDMWKATASVAD